MAIVRSTRYGLYKYGTKRYSSWDEAETLILDLDDTMDMAEVAEPTFLGDTVLLPLSDLVSMSEDPIRLQFTKGLLDICRLTEWFRIVHLKDRTGWSGTNAPESSATSTGPLTAELELTDTVKLTEWFNIKHIKAEKWTNFDNNDIEE